MRYRFDQVFETHADGSISPKIVVKLNGEVVPPTELVQPGYVRGGFQIDQHQGEDVEVEEEGDASIVMGFYPKELRIPA